ncbi:hypothetical protein B0T19DRAFT_387177 [Cercophora scortea]|uniref:Uncharacterized protein n=1 Tax=Cercophora scortea TaxID=314031 RepID=A0AAE0M7A2_9PEZI|nr:hypothetical protein B0T19DRAFT_387177 [Cercophora scortea]
MPLTQVPAESLERDFFTWSGPDHVPGPKPAYKPTPDPETSSNHRPIPDPFPLLSQNISPSKRNRLLNAHRNNNRGKKAATKRPDAEKTPLMIGFTRNWPQLLQCVVSYIAAGWPPEDILVVENTGAMHSNRDGRLTLQNPFYLNHTQLGMLGVSVLETPTLLTFAQLQNFYAWTALENSWPEYFWSHQDLLVFSPSSPTHPSPTLHDNALNVLRYLRQPTTPKWAHHFFAYDHLTLVHRDAILAIGGWDTHIPYYATDCDMYARLMWAGYWQGETSIGIILDVSSVLTDVGALLRIPGIHASFPGDKNSWPDAGSDELAALLQMLDDMSLRIDEDERRRRKLVDMYGESWAHLVEVGRRMEEAKLADEGGRNTWQTRQTGGQGEPFAKDPEGFEIGVRMFIDAGRSVFAEKWGHRGCDIAPMGIKGEDAWRLQRDWDPETEGAGFEGPEW